jgi:hypothetical protein
MHSTAIVACERAKLFVAIWIGMLLVASTGSAVSAQDAIGGITGPNYPNSYPQSSAYSLNGAPQMNADMRPSRGRRSRVPARW